MPRIQFPIDHIKKDKMEHYAEVKGFRNAGALAQFATTQYMRKNPLKPEEKTVSKPHREASTNLVG